MLGNGRLRFRAIAREAERINRRPARTKRRRTGAEKPVGPRLVRGRGYARRRSDFAFARAAVYLLIAGALMIIVAKYGLIPFMTR